MTTFEELGLSERTLKVLKHKGFEEPTPIQIKTIPAILQGQKDIVGQAQTGTGKTAAFGLPMIELLPEKSKTVQAIVLTPTRELAIQVADEINSLKGEKRLSIIPVYGGQSIELQLRSLKKGVDIVVGTPGRVLDHLRRRTLKLDAISYLVLDEADEMLNMGFIEEVKEIIEHTGPEKRTMLFSATMPPEIMQIAQKYMGEYELIKVTKGQLTVSQTAQIYFEVSEADKFEALCRIIDMEEDFYGLIFCRTKIDVDKVANHMIERGYDADAMHGDMSQGQREKIMNKFKKRQLNVLIATDVAARGIDVQDLTHVINYALPQDPESYVHRIGRTGRAGKEGIAITFITPSEYRKLQFIQSRAKADIRRAKLPKIKDVIKAKKLRIKAELEDIIASLPSSEYLQMSRELLEKNEPDAMLAALLQYSFQDELNEKSYTEIDDAVVVDTKGKTRLFVTQGRQDGLTRDKLVDYIRDKCGCGLSSAKIKDIQILDKFSFVTLPFHEAEILLTHFKHQNKRKGPFIKKANIKGQK
ncbi:MAG: DEAD/DEAH box helicase [Nitrospirae bacterium]|nr:DEAD/DEAH box helicase [Nitrospirota bacterium]